MGGIFVSYRREDAAPWAGRIYDALSNYWGRENVFMDIDRIALGEDFRKVINRTVSESDVVLVIIGPKWLTLTNESGTRRLDDEADVHRTEVVTALERDARVIPVLVGGASVPRTSELPEDLQDLIYRNAAILEDRRFVADMQMLNDSLTILATQLVAERKDREQRDRERRDQELRDQELRDRHLREQQQRDQKLRDRRRRDQQQRDQELRDQELREQDRRDQQQPEQEHGEGAPTDGSFGVSPARLSLRTALIGRGGLRILSASIAIVGSVLVLVGVNNGHFAVDLGTYYPASYFPGIWPALVNTAAIVTLAMAGVCIIRRIRALQIAAIVPALVGLVSLPMFSSLMTDDYDEPSVGFYVLLVGALASVVGTASLAVDAFIRPRRLEA